MLAPQIIFDLVERFDRNINSYKSGNYNEAQVRSEFINPFFEALGWDVINKAGYAEAYKDVIHEYSLKTMDVAKAPDYLFRIGGNKKFFVEAKKPSVNLKEDISPAFQLRRYAWSAKLPLSILTDFEEFVVYDCRIQPKKNDKPSTARITYLTYKDYIEKWDEIETIFSKDAVLKGSFDKFAETNKGKRGTTQVDDAFLSEIEKWREQLARNIALRNPDLTNRELNYSVQKVIDRIIFLRISEDRGIEDYGQLYNLLNGPNTYSKLKQIFTRADEKYNSGLFHFDEENNRTDPADTITPNISIDDKVLKEIFKFLYYPDCPYEFSVLGADILGHVYEQFLGKVIRLTAGHRAVIEEKPEVKKAGGVYYTPTYIVDYIVKNTLGKKLDEITARHSGLDPESISGLKEAQIKKIINEAAKLKILDPACGSGSFLIGAYQYLLDWHLKIYTNNVEQISNQFKNKDLPIYQVKENEYRLTTNTKKKILLNNIYGVDIDSQAVEVTKLSLVLKVLEGETQETLNSQLSMFRERALPDLSENIKCGNSLIGPDFYNQTELALDDEERYRINVFDWQREFKEIMTSGGFDIVIGNPPYVRQELNKNKSYFSTTYKSNNPSADIYVYFIEKGTKILKNEGILGFIVANKWLLAGFGIEFRNYLMNFNLDMIINFGDIQIFKGATTYTCLLFIRNTEKKNKSMIANISDQNFSLEHISNFFYIEPKLLSENSEKGWILEPQNVNQLLKRLETTYSKFEDLVSGNVYRGILTGLDKAFVINEETKNLLINKAANSIDIIRPYLIGKDIQRYKKPIIKRYIIFIPKGWTNKYSVGFSNKWKWFQNNYPAIAEYLAGFEIAATKRWDKGDYWWELRACDYYEEFNKDKMMFLKFQVKPQFISFSQNAIVNSAIWFVTNNVKYLTAIMNSKLGWFLISKYCTRIQSGFQLIYKYIKNIPIVERSNIEIAKTRHIELLVDNITNLQNKFDNSKTPQEKTTLQRQIEATDKQIDQLVYELYGLTEEEIKIVEGIS